ncbi:ExeM/NucH family extracellular endonuclease [Salinibacterium sp. NK8237]|uniref:ExeM/NucH family extracellular endonuclease n=1 Tax=Salinibacterium sp. NK8237 TaxID=2792038 RepID=UPI0018CD4326|nr:ExeM/NucH family extracellular endonuclease [Salinibacterium sp. NK8237]MBH0130129.1 ExeM/NucH family extracellular endonuclease [Salinibacterium sp. NK8237]
MYPRSSRPTRLTIGALATSCAIALATITAPAALAAEATYTIAQVQGTSASSTIVGTTVTVEGVVTADYRGASGYSGIVIQTPGSGGATDATPGASDGIFVYLGSANPAVSIGDKVTATGPVGEYYGLTQLGSGTTVELVTAAADLAAEDAVEASALDASVVGTDRESLESMLVAPTGDYLVSSSHQLYNYGTLWLSPEELAVKSTETTDAGADADAIAAANRASRILLDDGYNIQVSSSSHPGEQPYFSADTVVRNGDTVEFPANPFVLSYGFDDWRLQPTIAINDASPAEYLPTFESTNPREETAPEVGGDFKVSAFNVYNYFTTLTSEDSDARGADTAEEFAIQQSKIVAAINSLDADVVGLMEIENSIKLGGDLDEALMDLVGALNAAAGAGTWDYVPTPAALDDAAITDFITNAIIFKPAAATPVGDSFTQVDESVWDIAREPIAQTFESNGELITVVANHFKSKGGSGTEPTDGQGFFNTERVEQANAVKDLVDSISADEAKSDQVVLVGDFNAYSEEDPIQVFTEAGYVDTLAAAGDEQYTYTFDGELGSLDHIIVSPSLADHVTDAAVWNINSPEWSDRGYAYAAADASSVFRSSDHDPISIGLSTEAAPVEIEILTTNDFHGRIEAGSGIPGAAMLAGMVRSWESQNPNTTFVGAGDFVGATTFTSFIQNDQPTIDVLNEIGLDTSSFGNHEFDQGRADVDDRILDAADWPYLAANIYDRDTNAPAYDEYFLQEFEGVTVGFIGAITEDLEELVSPAGIASLEIRGVVEEVDRVADYLTDGDDSNGEADVLVLLIHEGAASTDIAASMDDSAFGQIVTDVSPKIQAIVSGHTHLAYDHEIEVAGMDSPRLVISAGQYGSYYGHFDLNVDPATMEILEFSAEVLPIEGFEPDAAVQAIVDEATEAAAELGNATVGEITESMFRAVQSPTDAAEFPENRGGESTIGNFVADVQLWAASDSGAEIAFMNPGGLRTDLIYEASGAGDADGEVTYREAANVQPFGNTLTTMSLTGEQIKSVLEEQWQPEGAQRPFLKLGVSEGLTYSYDPTAVQGERVTAMYLNGVPVDVAASYTVVANSFLAAGGDNFATLAEGTDRADSGRVDLQSMVEWFEENTVASPPLEQRAIGAVVSEPAAGGFAPGDDVTLDLSSLTFSRGGSDATTVEVSVDGTVLGSATIDRTIVDTTDEQGRASVTVTVPAGTPSGTLALTVTVPGTDTAVVVPIEVAATEEAIENTKAPSIRGNAKVGSTVNANGGKWSVNSTTLSFQWLRDGVPIANATDRTYKVTAADVATELSVQVTASKDGYADGVAVSDAETVDKIASRVSASTSSSFVWGNRSVTVDADVSVSKGGTTAGEVTFYDGRTAVGTSTVDKRGEASLKLPKLSRGIHFITVKYSGNDLVESSTSWPRLVFVF